VNWVLLVLAVICFTIVGLAGFAVITVDHGTGWLGFGLAFFTAAHFPFAGFTWPRRTTP
jgi:hypothetical protein